MPELGADILEYFRAVARGDCNLTRWRDFMTAHARELERGLSRARWLRLKFEPREELPRLLDELRIAYRSEELDQRLRWAARGMDWEPVFRDPHQVRALYAAGRTTEADGKLMRAALELATSAEPHRGLYLGETVLDAEALLDAGHVDEALGMLLAVALLPRDDDLIDPAIAHADSVLRCLAPAEVPRDLPLSELVAQLRSRRAGT